jgi:hypothetical protein
MARDLGAALDASGYLPVRAATLTALLAVRDAGQCLALAGFAGQERSYVDRYKRQFRAAPVDIQELDTVAGHFTDDYLAVEEDEMIAGPDSTGRDLPGQVETRPLAEMDDPFDRHPEVLPGGGRHMPHYRAQSASRRARPERTERIPRPTNRHFVFNLRISYMRSSKPLP